MSIYEFYINSPVLCLTTSILFSLAFAMLITYTPVVWWSVLLVGWTTVGWIGFFIRWLALILD